MKVLIRVLLVTISLLPASAWSKITDLAEFESWLRGLEVDPRVAAEIVKFTPKKGGSLSAAYAEDFARNVRRIIVRDTATWINLVSAGKQAPFIKVSYPEAGFSDPALRIPGSQVEQAFEESFVQTEVLALFNIEGVTPETALREYTKPAFRQQVSSQLKAITKQEGLSCVETKAVPIVLDPTLACNHIEEFHRPGISAQHSQVVANKGESDFQLVYYKESLKVFVEVPEGLALYYINFSRISELGSMSKFVGDKKITQSQQKAIDTLQQVLVPE